MPCQLPIYDQGIYYLLFPSSLHPEHWFNSVKKKLLKIFNQTSCKVISIELHVCRNFLTWPRLYHSWFCIYCIYMYLSIKETCRWNCMKKIFLKLFLLSFYLIKLNLDLCKVHTSILVMLQYKCTLRIGH